MAARTAPHSLQRNWGRARERLRYHRVTPLGGARSNRALECSCSNSSRYCPACRSKLGILESVGGHFIDCELPDETDVSQSWQSLKARIDAGEIENVLPIKKNPRQDKTYPKPLNGYIEAAGGLKLYELGRGAARMLIPTGDNTTTVRLLKIPAGQPVPEHSHRGMELTLVLEGSVSDAVSTFSRGDVEMRTTR